MRYGLHSARRVRHQTLGLVADRTSILDEWIAPSMDDDAAIVDAPDQLAGNAERLGDLHMPIRGTPGSARCRCSPPKMPVVAGMGASWAPSVVVRACSRTSPNARLLGSYSSLRVLVDGGGDVMDEPGVPSLVRLQVCGQRMAVWALLSGCALLLGLLHGAAPPRRKPIRLHRGTNQTRSPLPGVKAQLAALLLFRQGAFFRHVTKPESVDGRSAVIGV